MNDLRPKKILQRREQSRRCFFDDRLAGQWNDPCKIGSRTGEARFNHQPFRPVAVTNQCALVWDCDLGWIGNGRNDHAVGQCRERQKQEKRE